MAVVTIEKLLHWAFVEQMPPPDAGALMNVGDFGPWSAIVRVGELGTLVDRSRNPDPGPSWTIVDPDPDAVAIVNAVAALDELDVIEAETHDLMAGWPDFGEVGEAAVARAWDILTGRDDAGRRVLKSPVSLLVRRVAVLGEWPKWECEAPRVEFVKKHDGDGPAWFRKVRQAVAWDADGEPTRWVDVEVDGYSRSAKRPYAGAYRKLRLFPDVSGALAARIEYGLTYAALEQLIHDLNGIGGRSILPMMGSAMPWA